jgi:hypothetical protein
MGIRVYPKAKELLVTTDPLMVITYLPRPSVLDTALRAAARARTKHPGAVYREQIIASQIGVRPLPRCNGAKRAL